MTKNIIKMIIEELVILDSVLVLSTGSATYELMNDGGLDNSELLDAIKFIVELQDEVLDFKIFNKGGSYTRNDDGKLLLIKKIRVAGE